MLEALTHFSFFRFAIYKKVRGFPPLLNHLGDKADFTPSPLLRSGSNRGCLTGETNDFVRCYGFAHAEQASVTLLMPRRNHCSPPSSLNGAERNRTAVRNTGVDHLVHLKLNISILPVICLNGSIFNHLDKNNFMYI